MEMRNGNRNYCNFIYVKLMLGLSILKD